MEFFLGKRLETSIVPSKKLVEITDFPRLKRKQITRRIAYGSFHLRQSRSYVSDFMKIDKVYVPTTVLLKSMPDTSKLKQKLLNNELKIVATELVSRHKRSEFIHNGKKTFRFLYKCFVLYDPKSDGPQGIRGNFNSLSINY